MNAAPALAPTLVQCDFCGLKFDPTCVEVQSCTACPLAAGCAHSNCPRCGYPILPEPSLLRWLRRLPRRAAKNGETHETK